MLPLPLPERGGFLDELKDFINVSSDQFVLVKAWLLATMRPQPSISALGGDRLCRISEKQSLSDAAGADRS